MSSVHLRQLSKRYHQTPVLDGVNLDIQHGEFVVLVGPAAAASRPCCA